jgi:hypothetical protein
VNCRGVGMPSEKTTRPYYKKPAKKLSFRGMEIPDQVLMMMVIVTIMMEMIIIMVTMMMIMVTMMMIMMMMIVMMMVVMMMIMVTMMMIFTYIHLYI